MSRPASGDGGAAVCPAASFELPVSAGDHVKTDRRDAATLASLFRSGELTPVWVPDDAHEAMRDLCRARQTAMEALRRARQQVLSFLLRHGHVYSGGGHWTRKHRLWLAAQRFDRPARQIAFEETRAGRR
ncbi:MAG: IS110 family transposase [Sphingomicrobium sp.]